MTASKQTLITGQYYPKLDCLRGYAVLGVIWFHCIVFCPDIFNNGSNTYLSGYYAIAMLGQTGVDLFFVLSGFLITGILIDTAESNNRYKSFLIRRSLRIFPLYFLYLFVFAVCLFYFLGANADFQSLWQYVFYFQNWQIENRSDEFKYLIHFWSLAVEEQFYLVWPFVFWFMYARHPNKIAMMLMLLTAMSWLLRFYFVTEELYKPAVTWTFFRMDGLTLGALASVLLKNHKEYVLKHISTLKKCAAGCTLSLIVIVLIPETLEAVSHRVFGVGMAISTILYFCLVLIVVLSHTSSFYIGLIWSSVIQYIGKLSYGIYVFNLPVCIIVFNVMRGQNYNIHLQHFTALFISIIVSFTIAHISYQFYEKKFLMLKDRFAPID